MNLLTVGFCFVAFDKRPGDGSSFTQASHGKIRGGCRCRPSAKYELRIKCRTKTANQG